ncbi:hypothetical protein [Algisphaera agarilytica]|uniref:Outer membrane lipoprotein-sorting protein n=1 Tax=Algisphaera agarilytica TaxID=1385975 RepID=A0A7X0H384_9BACT|nr:hypothetical protein [Algisphaera agarilytica]MBB6428468.1 outer membrane lipoprotein-sorting protein [Algisphaera agarilytica]
MESMMKLLASAFLVCGLVMGAGLVTGCAEESSDTGAAIESAASDAKDAAEDAAKEGEKAAEDAADALKDATE